MPPARRDPGGWVGSSLNPDPKVLILGSIMKTFQVPLSYQSPLITAIKRRRKDQDRLKKDFSPTLLDLGRLQILLARHFGFCYGVENAIEISFRAVEENPEKRIYLLSEMIHNPVVNQDLASRGVRFLLDTGGRQIIPWEELTPEDIVIIPAFGTTLETGEKLRSIGIEPLTYNTTCPFVERVWNKAESIGNLHYTVILHGKPGHEETRATFSHSRHHGPTVVVRDMEQAMQLAGFINKSRPPEEFAMLFRNQASEGFDPSRDLERVGVVNQTTMLAAETQEISDFIRRTMIRYYGLGESEVVEHFADTRDTLCYATNDNQSAVTGMLRQDAEMAIVVGGYNSSNTTHLVELMERKLPTYFISSAQNLVSPKEILHWDFRLQREILTPIYTEGKAPLRIMVTSGASCPDALVEGVLEKLVSFFGSGEQFGLLKARYAASENAGSEPKGGGEG